MAAVSAKRSITSVRLITSPYFYIHVELFGHAPILGGIQRVYLEMNARVF